MNKRTRTASEGRRRLLAICASGLFFCLGASSLWAVPARVDNVHGDVDKRQVGALGWQKVNPGERIDEGTTVRTGSNSEADVLTAQGHHFKIRPETSIEFTSLQADETKTHLDKGRVLSSVHKLKPNERFSLQTPTAVCAVRGTEFDTVTGDKGTMVAVYHGVVGVSLVGSDTEVRVPAGQMTAVHNGTIEIPRPMPHDNQATRENPISREARHEVGLDMSRNQVIAAAAMEMRMADYREGKSLTDVNGQRVRVEEYIVRPRPDQFKLVALDKRANDQLDYFFYLGTFNQTLPTDLSVALKDLSGKFGTTAPDYYLTAYEMGQSNTKDSVHDTGTGGHLVQVTVDTNGDYVLTDPTNPGNTRTVLAAQSQPGNTYLVYNPISDSFTTVDAAQLASATKFGVYIPENDTFKDLAPGDSLWETRFNTYAHQINNNNKINYAQSGSNNVLARNLDAAWTYAGGSFDTVVTVDADKIDATVTTYYGDHTQESYRTVLIDDNGVIAPLSAFAGVSSGAEYKGELLKWNYEQQVSATEFEGRKIDLVVEPKIFIKSGLIQ